MLKKRTGTKNYQGISLDFDLVDRIDMILEDQVLGYKSRSEFVREAIRLRLDDLEEKEAYLKKKKDKITESV